MLMDIEPSLQGKSIVQYYLRVPDAGASCGCYVQVPAAGAMCRCQLQVSAFASAHALASTPIVAAQANAGT